MRISDWSSDVCSSDLAPSTPTRPSCAGASAPVAEQLTEQVRRIEAALGLVLRARSAFGVGSPEALVRPLVAGRVDLAAIEPRSLLGIGEQIVCAGGLLELQLDLRIAGVQIGMQLLRELAVGLLDVVLRRRARHAEDIVRVSHRFVRPPWLRQESPFRQALKIGRAHL